DAVVQVFPLRVFRIVGRLDRIWSNVTERARHAHTIGTHEIWGVVVVWIAVVAFRIPVACGLGIELRVREETQPDNARSVTVVRANGHRLWQILIWLTLRQRL